MTKIISWNVNSINARIESLSELLKNENPDVLLLQEIKCLENTFPFEYLLELGYNSAICGQKTYNGVAILSKYPLEDVITSFTSEESTQEHLNKHDRQKEARYIEAVVSLKDGTAIRVASIYAPNGQANGKEALDKSLKPTESERFLYKMAFYNDMYNHFKETIKNKEICIFGGDYNIAPTDLDVYSIKNWQGKVCFLPEEKQKFKSLLDLGLTNCHRFLKPNDQLYTWYDYRMQMFQKQKGLTIDHTLISNEGITKLKQFEVLNKYRAMPKPSDHVPILIQI